MSLIQNQKIYRSSKANSKPVLLLCGFGGAIWQTRLLTRQLNKAGYDVTALDFPKRVLSEGDPKLLPQLVDEVCEYADAYALSKNQEVLLVGISLGSLLSLNILRRSDKYLTAIMITGGNIVTVAKNIFGNKIWPQSPTSLSALWAPVNIWSDPKLLANKEILFVLPTKDKLIDTHEVVSEIARQNNAGNSLQLIKRTHFGHVGTIIVETIIFPKRIVGYIRLVKTLKRKT